MNSANTKNPVQPLPQYAEEVLCADWNPVAPMPAEPLAQAQKPVLDSGEIADVEAFLARLYVCQRA